MISQVHVTAVVVVVVATILGIGPISPVKSESTVQYRISESQFNDIAVNLFRLSKTDRGDIYGDEQSIKADSVYVSIPRDGIIRTTAYFDTVVVTGSIQLKFMNDAFVDYPAEVQIRNCTLVSEGSVDSVTTVNHADGRRVTFQVNGCVMKCASIMIPTVFGQSLAHYANNTEILQKFTRMVCENYEVTYTLEFQAERLAAHMINVTGYLTDTQIQVINSSILLTQTVSYYVPSYNPKPPGDMPGCLPHTHPPTAGYEVWIHSSLINEAFVGLRRQLFSIDSKVSLTKLLSVLSTEYIQKLGVFIPRLGYTFPNSTFDVVMTDLKGYGNIYNNSFWIHANITGEITATLNCDPNRKYTAAKFRAIISAQMQVASDNIYVGMKIATFNGNVTILETNIGRVADRLLETVFLVLPRLLEDQGFFESEKFHGARLAGILPTGYNIENVTLKMVNDYIVIGGQLTTTNTENSRIPYKNVTWIGAYSNTDNVFPLLEDTPENATGMPIQNCTAPPTHVTTSSGSFCSTNMATLVIYWMLMYILSCCLK